MSKISDTFTKYKKVFIPYITVGDVNLSLTEELILEMSKRDAHIIELGVPFSDPLADGPTIQRASERALKRGINFPDIFHLVGKIRKKSNVPIVLMSYYNPIYKFGVQEFMKEAKSEGIDGIIIPDLPPEEASKIRKTKMDTIFLIAPTSTENRIKLIATLSSGFIYCVSVTGTTGARGKLEEDAKNLVSRIRRCTDKPIAVGFGVSTQEQVREIIKLADGVIVGSAILEVIEKYRDSSQLVKIVGDFIEYLIKGISSK
ncbi:MAG: tryptophan synthase subunit alpha [Candidatus Stahlbacteria bacterium]|nr:tryptophan synthase subunit alpha [Candidatus Stahlbacteria bacterium]